MSNVIPFRPPLPEPAKAASWALGQSTDELKHIWSSGWIVDADPGCAVLEAIHAELNRRGFGHHCAV
jgi:hypothetical protein